MYLDFYGLHERPFSETPDPRFFFLSLGHREALAQLVYGVQKAMGLIVLTGEGGTGKTALLHAFMERIGKYSTHVALILDATMPSDGLVDCMLEDFGIPGAGKTRAERLLTLKGFLIERRRAGETVAVVIDEAQNLSLESLEHLRLLSSFETATGKPLLQIILAGQPELHDQLARPELRQLRQRLGLRCAIRPLAVEETRSYIQSRLHAAGAGDPRLFRDTAVERIAAYTSGIPRLVNILCDHCLLIGYTAQTRRVDREMVERTIEYMEDGQRPARARGTFWLPATRRLRRLVGGFGAAAIAGVTLLATAGDISAPGLIAGQFLDYARLARDLVMR